MHLSPPRRAKVGGRRPAGEGTAAPSGRAPLTLGDLRSGLLGSGFVSQPPFDDLSPRPTTPPFGRLAVLGLGQLGGSLALAGRAVGLFEEIVGFGRHAGSLARAVALGLADRTTTSAAEAVAGAATVVLAVPLGAIPAVVDAAAPAL